MYSRLNVIAYNVSLMARSGGNCRNERDDEEQRHARLYAGWAISSGGIVLASVFTTGRIRHLRSLYLRRKYFRLLSFIGAINKSKVSK